MTDREIDNMLNPVRRGPGRPRIYTPEEKRAKRAEYYREYRAKNREAYNEYYREYYSKNRVRINENHERSRKRRVLNENKNGNGTGTAEQAGTA